MKRLRSPSLLVLSLFALLVLHPLAGNGFGEEKEIRPPGGVYRRPLEFTPKTLDPALSIDNYAVTVIQQVFDGLVQFDKELNIIPAIAKSWEISQDGLVYTFHLREGVRFHNGREVTAEDFVYSFTRILDPETRSSSANFFTGALGAKEFTERRAKEVKGLVSKGRHVLRITLSEPYVPFISILAMKGAKVVPREEIEKSGSNFGKFPIGTGPFKLASMKEGEEIILDANPHYFEGRPYLDKIVFKIFHGAPREKILREFKEGDLEETFISPDELDNVIRAGKYPLVQKPMLSLRFYGFNLLSKPFDHKKLRKAVNLAIDKNFIVSEIHKNQFNPANCILPPGMPGYDPAKKPYPFNKKEAITLLSESGFQTGGKRPKFRIWSASKSEAAEKELNGIKTFLEQVGMMADFHFETNWPAYEAALRMNKAPVFLYAWYADFPDPDNFLGTLFHSKSRYNYTSYHNPEVDRLLEKARKEKDYLKRIQMYRKIEDIVLDDAPIVPMVNHLFQQAYQPYVRGIEVSALGGPYIPMKKIWLRKGGITP